MGVECMYILFFTITVLKLFDCQLQSGVPQRTDGEDFIEYIRRVDLSYCQDKFCMESRGLKQALSVNNSCESVCPHRCQCDSHCVLYGDCCPDYHNGTYYTVKVGMYSCMSDYLKPRLGSTNFRVVTSCPQSFENPDISKMCQESKSSTQLSFRTYVSTDDAMTYGNAYCAICNGKSSFAIWKLQGLCERQFHIPSTNRPDQLINIIWSEGECNFHLTSPPSRGIVIRECGAVDTHIISTCNVTGHWAEYNADIEKACISYTHVFEKYKNPFCYICNSATPYFNKCVERPSPKPQQFFARLDFKADEYVGQSQCDRGHRYDAITDKCREIFCIDGKWLKEEEKCTTVIRPPPNSIYKLSMFYAADIVLHDVHCLEFIPNQSSFSELSDRLIRRFFSLQGISSHTKPLTVKTSAMLINIGDLYCGQDGSYNITAEYNVRWIIFTLTLVSLDNLDIDVLEEMLFNSTKNTYKLEVEGFGTVFLTSMHRMTNLTDLRYVRIIPMKSVVHWVPNSGIEIEITKHRTCPFIILTENEYELLGNGSVLYIPSVDYYVPPEEYQFENMSRVRICAEQFYRKVAITLDKRVTDYTSSVTTSILHKDFIDESDSSSKASRERHVTTTDTESTEPTPAVGELCNMTPVDDDVLEELSIICVCLSGLCLLITLLVYCMLKPLRTFQGIINMALIICLLLAQISHAIIPDQDAIHILHVISGITTHYLWIATLLWLNVCSFHVLRSFGPKCISSDSNNRKMKPIVFLLYILYCHLIPAVFVGVNVGASVEMLDDIGYNTSICFTSNPYLLGLTFALPIGIALIINIVMFCAFVNAGNKRFQSLTTRSTDIQYPQLYFGLSLIAVSTWLCSILYQFIGYTVYNYLFMFMNSLQGVLIFLTCACNSTTCGILMNKETHLSVALDNARGDTKEEKQESKSLVKTDLSSHSSGRSLTDPPKHTESAQL